MMTTSSSNSQLFTDNKETLSKLITQSSSILQRLSAESSLEIPNHIYSSFTQSHNIQFNSSDQVVLSAYLENTIAYLSKLYTRINDTHSRVLVTGDLNAGKSTFVNTMLRREVINASARFFGCFFLFIIFNLIFKYFRLSQMTNSHVLLSLQKSLMQLLIRIKNKFMPFIP